MPELDIQIGGRVFQVACQPGEEGFLHSAAALLDAEAQPMVKQSARLPESRMLLMAGLMLADRMAGFDERLRDAEARAAQALARAEALEAQLHGAALAPPPEPVRIEVAVLPPGLTDRLAELAAEAEALAEDLEERAGMAPSAAAPDLVEPAEGPTTDQG